MLYRCWGVMKKLSVLSLSMLMLLSGCGGGGSSSENNVDKSESQPTTPENSEMLTTLKQLRLADVATEMNASMFNLDQ